MLTLYNLCEISIDHHCTYVVYTTEQGLSSDPCKAQCLRIILVLLVHKATNRQLLEEIFHANLGGTPLYRGVVRSAMMFEDRKANGVQTPKVSNIFGLRTLVRVRNPKNQLLQIDPPTIVEIFIVVSHC